LRVTGESGDEGCGGVLLVTPSWALLAGSPGAAASDPTPIIGLIPACGGSAAILAAAAAAASIGIGFALACICTASDDFAGAGVTRLTGRDAGPTGVNIGKIAAAVAAADFLDAAAATAAATAVAAAEASTGRASATPQ